MARKRRDALRTKLDRLAEQIADEVLSSGEVTLRDKVTALKIAGAYWGLSRKGEKPDDESDAWGVYQRRITGNGKDHDAAQDDA
jgi:hypothetical protein